LLELSRIAERQGEADRAAEILESALEIAATHRVEGSRLERSLRAQERWETLVKALRLRLAREGDGPNAAEVLFEIADVTGTRLGRDEEAFASALRAVELAPGSPKTHASMLALARRSKGVPRYVEALTRLASQAESRRDDALASELYVRL